MMKNTHEVQIILYCEDHITLALNKKKMVF